MEITLLTHDPRWKGFGPTVKRAAEVVLVELCRSGFVASSPLEGEPNHSFNDLVGGKMMSAPAQAKALKSLPTEILQGGFRLPLKGRVRESSVAAALSLTIVLSDDAEVQTLNHQFRHKNKPTNVLSFPDGSMEKGVMQLGDIILAYETIAAETVAQNKKMKHHLAHLTIHGVLHLLGYDHEEEEAANVMESLEIFLLSRMGIANPYETF